MGTLIQKKILRTAVTVFVAIFLFFSSGLRIPVLDTTTDNYFREAITKASLTYAACRVINASVSVVKDSSLNLEPAGIGVTLAVGQVLDPIDDMVERVSDVLVTAITSLGVQKLVFEIGVSIAPPIIALFLVLSSLLIWSPNEKLAAVQKNTTKLIVLILLARFALPISALANNFLQEHFFTEQISMANQELAVGTLELDKLKQFSLPEVDGVLGTIKNNATFIQQKSKEFKHAIITTVSNAGTIVENLLKLAFLYVGVFLIQVIALPIMVFWLLVRFSNSLFDQNLPELLQHSRESINKM